MNKVLFRDRGIYLGWAIGIFCAVMSTQAQTNASAAAVANTNRLAITNPPPAPRRPPIVLIVADNIGYGDLGCYGQSKIKTPNLDKLASEGIRFTSFYAGSPQDELSRAALLTGLEPRHIGASVSHPLPMDAVTVAAVLKESGYHTGLIGEWNLGDTPPVQPIAKGFDEFAGFLSAGHARNYFADNIYRQDVASGSNRVEALPDNWNGERKLYLPDLLGRVAASFVKNNHPESLNHYRGFFLCVSYPVPHVGELPQDDTYAGENWPQAQKDRATMITRMDKSIGVLLNQLAQYKLDTNAVVIFTSIGGAEREGEMDPKFFNSNGALRGQAGSVYEGGIRVPMIIRWPARIKGGQVSDTPCAAWDLLPTLADIAIMKLPKNTDGRSLMPLLVGKGKVDEHESLYWETRENDLQQAVRMGDWKMVRIGTNSPALYNLKEDIGERNDVAPKNADMAKKMEKILGGPLK